MTKTYHHILDKLFHRCVGKPWVRLCAIKTQTMGLTGNMGKHSRICIECKNNPCCYPIRRHRFACYCSCSCMFSQALYALCAPEAEYAV